jgi:hypothetical protein
VSKNISLSKNLLIETSRLRRLFDGLDYEFPCSIISRNRAASKVINVDCNW